MTAARSCLTLCDPHGLSMEFSRQEYWIGYLFPFPGDLPNPEIKSRSPALQADSLPAEPPGKSQIQCVSHKCCFLSTDLPGKQSGFIHPSIHSSIHPTNYLLSIQIVLVHFKCLLHTGCVLGTDKTGLTTIEEFEDKSAHVANM